MTRPAITIWRHGQASTPEPLLDIAADGRVTGYTGHVDLGTGLRTAMAQIVAEELDIAPGQVSMVMGDTALCIDQGGGSASAGIQHGGKPLRNAAAEARRILVDLGFAPARLASTAEAKVRALRAALDREGRSAPAEGGRDVPQDGLEDVGVVVDAELVGDREEQRVRLRDRLVGLELGDQSVGLGGVGPAEHGAHVVDDADLIAARATAEIGPVPVVDEREDGARDRDARLAPMAAPRNSSSRLPAGIAWPFSTMPKAQGSATAAMAMNTAAPMTFNPPIRSHLPRV